MGQQQIHWFPGHMNKALKEIENHIKLVDVVIELLDARAPLSSINENLEEIIANKKKLIVLTKIDMADPKQTDNWVNKLKERYEKVLALDLTNPSSDKAIAKAVYDLGEDKRMKDKKRGMKPQPIKTMIIGIPNVGKSSLINRLAKRSAAGVQNKPGYTRGQQWIKVNNDFLLLDTPGVLPMNYENKDKATKLAIIGAIREEILPNTDLCDYLINFLKGKYPTALKDRYGIEEINESEEVMKRIALRRGLLKAGNPDIEKAEVLLLNEMKNAKLGRITLEWLLWR